MDEKTATRDRILHAASARMMHYGYCKTTMAEIAADCGMSPGNIYRFFEAKIDIGEEMARKHFASKLGDLAAIVRRKEIAPDARLREVFLWRARDSFKLVSANAKVLELVDVLEHDRPMFSTQAAAQERVLVAALLEEGVQAGLFRPCDTEFTAEMIQIAMIKFAKAYLLAQSTLPKIERELNGVMDLVLRGLYVAS